MALSTAATTVGQICFAESQADRPQIWLTPFAAFTSPDGRRGAPDYFDLFKADAPWAYTAAHIRVFKIYLGQARLMSDAQLMTMAGGLEERHIALALEANVLLETSACAPGTGKAKTITPDIERLKRLGIKLAYLAMNEPLLSGHATHLPHDCVAPIEMVAADVAASLKPLLTVYPDLQIGDVEPVGRNADITDWPVQIARWVDAFRSNFGKPLAFLHADVVWGRPWEADLQQVAQIAQAAGIPFGVIYNGDSTELSDAAWARDTARNAALVEDNLGIRPDQVLFQSWFHWPQHTLPDSDSTTMTGMVRDYLKPRSRFAADRSGRLRLTDEAGTPIANTTIEVEKYDPLPGGALVPKSIEGEVPPGATAALIALRLNAECLCPKKQIRLEIGEIQFAEKSDGSYDQSPFTVNLHDWVTGQPRLVSAAAAGAGFGVDISVRPDQRLAINSSRFAVSGGAPFQARFLWQVDHQSDDAGYLAIIFFGANGDEMKRTREPTLTTWRFVATTMSDQDGYVQLRPGEAAKPRSVLTELSYRGDERHRAAQYDIPMQ